MRSALLLHAAAITCLLNAGPVSAQSDLQDYLRALQDSRSRSLRQYQEWQRDRLDGYRRFQGGTRGNPADFSIDLDEADVPPGSYNVQLPLGLNVRVNVGDQWGGRAWGPGNYGDLESLTRQLHERVRNVQLVLMRQGDYQQYGTEINYARETLSSLEDQFDDGAELLEVQATFRQFDNYWHPVAHELLNRYGASSAVGQHVQSANQLDDAFHRLLNIGPSTVYDRIRVVALSRQLTDSTDRLVDLLRYYGRGSLGFRRILRQAERVDRHARDFYQVVLDGAPYRVVQDEYVQFDDAWHRLVRQASAQPLFRRDLRQVGWDIWQVDQAIHEELLVSPPVIGNDQRAINLAEMIAGAAEYLAYELEWELGRGRHEAVDAAQNLAQVARNLQDELSRSPSSNRSRREVRLVREWWEYLDRQLSGLDGSRFRQAHEIGARLDDLVRRLENSVY